MKITDEFISAKMEWSVPSNAMVTSGNGWVFGRSKKHVPDYIKDHTTVIGIGNSPYNTWYSQDNTWYSQESIEKSLTIMDVMSIQKHVLVDWKFGEKLSMKRDMESLLPYIVAGIAKVYANEAGCEFALFGRSVGTARTHTGLFVPTMQDTTPAVICARQYDGYVVGYIKYDTYMALLVYNANTDVICAGDNCLSIPLFCRESDMFLNMFHRILKKYTGTTLYDDTSWKSLLYN